MQTISRVLSSTNPPPVVKKKHRNNMSQQHQIPLPYLFIALSCLLACFLSCLLACLLAIMSDTHQTKSRRPDRIRLCPHHPLLRAPSSLRPPEAGRTGVMEKHRDNVRQVWTIMLACLLACLLLPCLLACLLTHLRCPTTAQRAVGVRAKLRVCTIPSTHAHPLRQLQSSACFFACSPHLHHPLKRKQKCSENMSAWLWHINNV